MMQTRLTMGDLRELATRHEAELAKLECDGWSGCGITIDPKTGAPMVTLILQRGSKIVRWLYKTGIKKLPDHPATIGNMPVIVEVRGVVYAGGPPPGFFTRLYRRVFAR
jgi:hypothetical protein